MFTKEYSKTHLGITVCRLFGTFISLGFVYLIIKYRSIHSIIMEKYNIDGALYFIAIGWLLFSIRVWIRNGMNKKDFGNTSILSMFPIYLLNYPLLIITLYLIIKYLISPLSFINTPALYVISFLFGLSVDLIWNNLSDFVSYFIKSAMDNLKKVLG